WAPAVGLVEPAWCAAAAPGPEERGDGEEASDRIPPAGDSDAGAAVAGRDPDGLARVWPRPEAPRHREDTHCRGDPVVRRAARPALRAITDDDRRSQAHRIEVSDGLLDQLIVDVDAGHLGGADAVGEQGGVVPGAGAQLEHAVPVLSAQRIEHAQHDG